MALLTRTWPALASWGSGLLHLSLGASVLLAAEETGGVAAAVEQSWMQFVPDQVTECGFSDPTLVETIVNWLSDK